MRLGIAIEPGRISAVALRRGRVVWAAEAPHEDSEDLARALSSLAAERPSRTRSASVLLGGGLARLKTVPGLPPMRRPDLAAHVRLHSKRYFLQNGIPLVTDALPHTGKDRSGPALLAAAPVPLIEAITAGLEAAGLRCGDIVPAEAADLTPEQAAQALADGYDRFGLAFAAAQLSPSNLSLLPEAVRAQRSRADRRSIARLFATAAAAWVIAGASWLYATARIAGAATAELEALRGPVAAAMAERQDLARATEALAVLGGAARGSGGAVLALAEVARGLPPSAFLVNLRLDDAGGSLSGYAPRASAVVAQLERSGAAPGAALDGAVTREVVAGHEYERFTIRFPRGGREQ